MQRWQLSLGVVIAYICISVAQEEWGYRDNGTAEWVQNYPDCGLDQQSPILLNSFTATWLKPSVLRSAGVRFELVDYNIPADGVFTNNGHTVNLELNYTDPSRTPRVIMTLNENTTESYLQSMHFHWPSEHKFAYSHQNLVLELHMVHREPINNRTLVLGYLFTLDCYGSRPGMDLIGAVVRRLTNVGDRVVMTAFAPQRLMPYGPLPWSNSLRMCDYYGYIGSLTTPPCTENVAWLVYSQAMCIEQWQMDAFQSVQDSSGLPMAGNARPLQPTNGRSILYLQCRDFGK